jgi:hypothetical protein
MRFARHLVFASAALSFSAAVVWAQIAGSRDTIVLENETARVVFDLGGGSLAGFRFKATELNPLSWNTPAPGDPSVHGMGHFLCLDRWGPPSAAEGANGMPYHGEASNVRWQVVRLPAERNGATEAEMTAALPKAGLFVRRTIRLSAKAPVMEVREEVTNRNRLGRLYNMVQHATIAPPFLDEDTLVDCNGRKGFAQGGELPFPEEPSFFWPRALNRDGVAVDMRRLGSDANPNVVSYTIEAGNGWVTAGSPKAGLLIGYLWKRTDYPWVSLWRDVRNGHPAARGLEFGSTGLHQPFPILVKKRQIWGRPLFEYLDAEESVTRSYTAFLMKIPTDFAGVGSIEQNGQELHVRERTEVNPREWIVDLRGLEPR